MGFVREGRSLFGLGGSLFVWRCFLNEKGAELELCAFGAAWLEAAGGFGVLGIEPGDLDLFGEADFA
jgi:hypothetical protein